MLVLQRKEGQSIEIGDDVMIFITRIKGNRVSVAIEAPPELSIRRGELTERAPPNSQVADITQLLDKPNLRSLRA